MCPRDVRRRAVGWKIHQRLVDTNHRVIMGTPQQLADKVKREIERARQIVKASGMQQN